MSCGTRTILSINGRTIVPARRDAPLRIGTSNLESFFQGGIGKVAVYSHELSPERIARHYEVMSGRKPAEAG